jgi:hypothetical protein
MKFASRNPPANGQLALALVVATLKELARAGALDAHGLARIISDSKRSLPKGPGERNEEALELLEAVRAEVEDSA